MEIESQSTTMRQKRSFGWGFFWEAVLPFLVVYSLCMFRFADGPYSLERFRELFIHELSNADIFAVAGCILLSTSIRSKYNEAATNWMNATLIGGIAALAFFLWIKQSPAFVTAVTTDPVGVGSNLDTLCSGDRTFAIKTYGQYCHISHSEANEHKSQVYAGLSVFATFVTLFLTLKLELCSRSVKK